MKKITFTALLLWLAGTAFADVPMDDERGFGEIMNPQNSSIILWIGLIIVVIIVFVVLTVLKKRKSNK